MKKAFIWGLAVVALAVFATSASAITCTIDTRPAATLLVPYFHVQTDGSTFSKDTIITVGNASEVETLAHVGIYNKKSILVLDFNIALTPFDIQAFSLGEIFVNGNIPSTPVNSSGSVSSTEVCERNPSASFGPGDYLRFVPTAYASPHDLANATTHYSQLSASFRQTIQDNLDYDSSLDCSAFPATGDGDIASDGTGDEAVNPGGSSNGDLYGYVTIDMVNYCTLSNPDDSNYWDKDAGGWENNLWGDYIIKSDDGIPTYGAPMVAIEADPSLNGFAEGASVGTAEVVRTFYGRYWESSTTGNTSDGGTTSSSENTYLGSVGLGALEGATYGDAREPLGIRYAVRYIDEAQGDQRSYMRVWRASADSAKNLCGSADAEPVASITFYDEDENVLNTSGSGCPSPEVNCNPSGNFPDETQRVDLATLSALFDPSLGDSGDSSSDGWAFLDFSSNATNLDQAWAGYDFESGVANLNAGIDGTQLDPTNCNPAGTTSEIVNPVVPFLVGLGFSL